MQLPNRQRVAFTLMELLVVIALIGILAALAIYFVPSFQTSARAARGGQDLQSWLNSARQRAIRDQAPRGLRLLYDATLNGYSRAQYLEQPDDLGGGRSYDSGTGTWSNLELHPAPSSASATGNEYLVIRDRVTGKPAYIYGQKDVSINRFPGADNTHYTDDDPPVQVGDYLEVNGTGGAHYILDSAKSDKKTAVFDMLKLASPLNEGISQPISNFRIMRRPRVIGDETFDLPRTIYVDRAIHNSYASTLTALEAYPAADLDIMFAPSGAVMQGSFTKQHVVLWVRSTEFATAMEGEPTLIVVYIQSGLVAAYPVNVGNTTNPYDLVK